MEWEYAATYPRKHRSIDAPWEDSSTAIPQELMMWINSEPVVIYCLDDVRGEHSG